MRKFRIEIGGRGFVYDNYSGNNDISRLMEDFIKTLRQAGVVVRFTHLQTTTEEEPRDTGY